MIIWVIAGLLGLATGLRIGWALVNKQSLVSTAMILALGSLGLVAALNWQPLTLLIDTVLHWHNISMGLSQVALIALRGGQLRDDHDRGLGADAGHHSQNCYRAVQRCRGDRGREFGDLLRRRSATGDVARGVPQAEPRLQRREVAVAAAAALRVVGADPGVVGRHASLQSQPAWPRPVRLHHRHRADRAGVRVLPAAGRGQHRSSSVSGRRPPCWAAPCWSSPLGRCCPASKTGSAPVTSCAPSSRCSPSSVGAIPMSASGYAPAARWCSGSPSGCR